MTAVFRDHFADLRRLPERDEALAPGDRRDARAKRVGKDQASGGFNRDVVDIQVADDMTGPRHVQTVVTLTLLIRFKNVLKTPDLERGGKQDLLVVTWVGLQT